MRKPNKEEVSLLEQALLKVADSVGTSQESIVKEFKSFGLKIEDWSDVWSTDIENCRMIANDYKKYAKIQAGAAGAGFGVGGWAAMVPDMAALATINIRQIQCIAMSYGFNIQSEGEKAEVWTVMAACVGVDQAATAVGKEAAKYWGKYILRTPYSKMPLLAVIKQVAKYLGIKITKRGFAKMIPFIGSIFGGGLNYVMTEEIGAKAIEYFEGKKKFCVSKGFNPHS